MTTEQNGRTKLREILNQYGSVSDKMLDLIVFTIKRDENAIVSDIKTFWDNVSNPAEYLDENGIRCDKKDADYIWLSIGIKDPVREAPLYIAFAKSDPLKGNCSSSHFCYYIAPRHLLEKNLRQFSEAQGKTEDTHKSFLKSVYDMLLTKEEWGRLPDYQILHELMKMSEAKIANDRKCGLQDKNCAYNEAETKLAYNIGLISVYGGDIVILADLDEAGIITNRAVVQSKTQLMREGFKSTEILPISFYQDRKELIFSATAEDFDLNDFGRMKHIIKQRRERFPEKFHSMPEDELFSKLRSSLEFDLKMTARNPYWASPFYNIRQDEIQYLLPLFMGSLSEEPSLAMVIGKGEYFYEVRTVLPLKKAYVNAACLASPPSTWLRHAALQDEDADEKD